MYVIFFFLREKLNLGRREISRGLRDGCSGPAGGGGSDLLWMSEKSVPVRGVRRVIKMRDRGMPEFIRARFN